MVGDRRRRKEEDNNDRRSSSSCLLVVSFSVEVSAVRLKTPSLAINDQNNQQ